MSPQDFIKNKRILVTGGTGSIGSAIVRELLEYKPSVIKIFSRDPLKQSALENRFGNSPITSIIGDIRDEKRLATACEDADIVFHAAAFKYVPQGEFNPFEVIQTNLLGTHNILSVAQASPTVSHFVLISTDKAVQPASVMGASKFLAERLVLAAHANRGKGRKIFAVVRLGNVLGSSGSVLPIFREQIVKGEIVITHKEMTRFFTTIRDAASFIVLAASQARGGDIFVPRMSAVLIKDLAEECIVRYGSGKSVSIRIGGMRAGEKLHELLVTPEEAISALETDNFFVIPPSADYERAQKEEWYADARPFAAQGYTTRLAPRLSREEINRLLDRIESESR